MKPAGARLFERPPTGVRPTPLGAAAVELARGLLSEIETAEEKIEAAVSGRGGYDPSMTAAPHGRRRPERLIPHFPSIVDIQCGEKAILL